MPTLLRFRASGTAVTSLSFAFGYGLTFAAGATIRGEIDPMPPRDERLPLDVLRRVMPKVEPDPMPRDPTLLETLTDSFYTENARTSKDVSARIKDDGKRR